MCGALVTCELVLLFCFTFPHQNCARYIHSMILNVSRCRGGGSWCLLVYGTVTLERAFIIERSQSTCMHDVALTLLAMFLPIYTISEQTLWDSRALYRYFLNLECPVWISEVLIKLLTRFPLIPSLLDTE